MLAKPAFGQPCNQCGFCCIAEPCELANEYLDCHQGPCKALEIEEGRALGLGVGCDADDPPENLGSPLVCSECSNVLIDPKYRDPDHHCPACGSMAVRKTTNEDR